jgi:hypothetical protein
MFWNATIRRELYGINPLDQPGVELGSLPQRLAARDVSRRREWNMLRPDSGSRSERAATGNRRAHLRSHTFREASFSALAHSSAHSLFGSAVTVHAAMLR